MHQAARSLGLKEDSCSSPASYRGRTEARRVSLEGWGEWKEKLVAPSFALWHVDVLPPKASLAPSPHLGDTHTHLPQGSRAPTKVGTHHSGSCLS